MQKHTLHSCESIKRLRYKWAMNIDELIMNCVWCKIMEVSNLYLYFNLFWVIYIDLLFMPALLTWFHDKKSTFDFWPPILLPEGTKVSTNSSRGLNYMWSFDRVGGGKVHCIRQDWRLQKWPEFMAQGPSPRLQTYFFRYDQRAKVQSSFRQ